MSVVKEFKEFAVKGNAIDLAVGVVIGAAFGKIVSSLVADIVMPPLGLLLGGVKFTHLQVVLREATEGTAAVTWNYGSFIQAVFDFLLVAWAIFFLIKAVNRLKRKQAAGTPDAPPPAPEILLLTEIRDALKARPVDAVKAPSIDS